MRGNFSVLAWLKLFLIIFISTSAWGGEMAPCFRILDALVEDLVMGLWVSAHTGNNFSSRGSNTLSPTLALHKFDTQMCMHHTHKIKTK